MSHSKKPERQFIQGCLFKLNIKLIKSAFSIYNILWLVMYSFVVLFHWLFPSECRFSSPWGTCYVQPRSKHPLSSFSSLPHFDDTITWRCNEEALWPLTYIQVSDDVVMANWGHVWYATRDVFVADRACRAVRLLQNLCAFYQLWPATMNKGV